MENHKNEIPTSTAVAAELFAQLPEEVQDAIICQIKSILARREI